MPERGAITDGIYRNATLGFSYKIPFGWVDRTTDMREGSEAGKSEVLLSVFERPPEVQAEGINPAVVIAVENRSSYPGLKFAAEYLDPITELATSKGFKVTHEPYEYAVGSKQLVRCDYLKEKSSVSIHQSSLAFLHKDWIVSITFLGTSDDEIDELMGGLSFSNAAPQRSK